MIARNTAFTFKGKAIDVKKLGRELNVRYVLEGSVQRGGNRLRVNVQLIDAETGNHLWAERFDKPVADLFDMQDEIVSRLANALDAQLIAAEARRAERSPHPDAMDLVFQGRAWLNKGLTPEYMAQARGFFERAMALDPENVEAHGRFGVGRCVDWSCPYDRRLLSAFAAAEATVTKALSLAPNHAMAHVISGRSFKCLRNARLRASLNASRHWRWIAIWPALMALIGFAKYLLGRGAETEAHVNEALRLSPRDTLALISGWCGSASPRCSSMPMPKQSFGCAGALTQTEIIPSQHFHLAAALARLGELDEARAAVQAGLALDPGFTIRRFRAANARSDNPTYLAGRNAL